MWQNIVGLKAAAADVEVPRKEALANSKTFSKMAAQRTKSSESQCEIDGAFKGLSGDRSLAQINGRLYAQMASAAQEKSLQAEIDRFATKTHRYLCVILCKY